MGKIRVEELALQMGIGSKEVLFLLQSIGVDVKSPQAALDESTVLAILQGKTHAPKQLIVRDSESKAFRPQKSALSRTSSSMEVRPISSSSPTVGTMTWVRLESSIRSCSSRSRIGCGSSLCRRGSLPFSACSGRRRNSPNTLDKTTWA